MMIQASLAHLHNYAWPAQLHQLDQLSSLWERAARAVAVVDCLRKPLRHGYPAYQSGLLASNEASTSIVKSHFFLA